MYDLFMPIKMLLRLNLGSFPYHIGRAFMMVRCYPTPSEGWGREGTPRRPNCRATPQGLDQRSNMEEVPKMARRRGSDAGQSREERSQILQRVSTGAA